MAYEQKPSSGTLFKNDKKSDRQPDYTGNYKDAAGKTWRVAAWLKQGQKGTFLSFTTSEPREQSPSDGPQDDLPF